MRAKSVVNGTWSFGINTYVGGRTDFLSPSGTTSDTTPLFSWRTVDGAARYDLWVSRIDVPQGQVIREQNLLTTDYTPATPLVAGTCRAWVRAISTTAEVGYWSLQRDFTIVDTGLPMDGGTNNNELQHPLSEWFARLPRSTLHS